MTSKQSAETSCGCTRRPMLQLDHLVLTVADIERSLVFYESVLGFRREIDPVGRVSLHLDGIKINLHCKGRERSPHAAVPMPGSADLCFVSDDSPEFRLEHLRRHHVEVIEGPVVRPGACGSIESIYFRDPDQNLIEWGRPLAAQ